jgi:lipopolysaccharide export system permease protein
VKLFTILDRYIIKELLGPFIFGIAAFSCILAGSSVLFYLIGDAIKYGIPVTVIIQLFIYKLPGIVVFTFPMSMLLATLLGFGRLSSDLEILALRAGGVGFYRLIIPVVCVGFSISVMTIWFNEQIVPQSTHSGQRLMRSYTAKNDPKLKQQVNFTEYDAKGFPQRIINVHSIDGNKLKDVTVAEYDSGHLSRVIVSKSGKWLASGGWEFYNGVMHQFSTNDPFRVTAISFKKEYIDIPIDPQEANKPAKGVDEMTSTELKAKIQLQRKLGEDPSQNLMQYYMKFSIPFACLIFSILGAAVGLRPHRSSSALGLGISLVIILVYYVLLSIGMGLGTAHVLPPIFAAWIPNLVVGTAALYLLKRVGF